MVMKEKMWKKRYNGLKKMTKVYKEKAKGYEQTLVQLVDRVQAVERKNKSFARIVKQKKKEEVCQDNFTDYNRDHSEKRIVNLNV
jgi:hypothetical protein